MKFDIKHDNELIAAGSHFWCKACITARPVAERSPDSRYCKGCFDILNDEASLLPCRGINRRPAWIPRPDGITTPPALTDSLLGAVSSGDTSKDTHPSFAPLKHGGGRPRKSGMVSRWTIQRREKELSQGALL
jgi:hypothetical protein